VQSGIFKNFYLHFAALYFPNSMNRFFIKGVAVAVEGTYNILR
jgi:hypothetical protein